MDGIVSTEYSKTLKIILTFPMSFVVDQTRSVILKSHLFFSVKEEEYCLFFTQFIHEE